MSRPEIMYVPEGTVLSHNGVRHVVRFAWSGGQSEISIPMGDSFTLRYSSSGMTAQYPNVERLHILKTHTRTRWRTSMLWFAYQSSR